MSRTIQLSNGLSVIVDVEDYDRLSAYKWAPRSHRRTVYSQRNIWINGSRTTVQMHREILGFKNGDGRVVDHINGNGLDNRRANLRECELIHNCQNRRTPSNNRSGFKGVHFRASAEKFWAYININGKRKHLGVFQTATEAAKAYNDAAIATHGAFAKLNLV